MKKQTFFPNAKSMTADNTIALGTLGLGEPDGTYKSRGRDWEKQQVYRDDTFLVSAAESYSTVESTSYTKQQDYIKVNFWLNGKHTTVLDGFGQHEHDRPEAFITAGPPEMIKLDLASRDTHLAFVAVCLLRDFFPVHMGIAPDQLPEPLRGLFTLDAAPYAFYRFPLTPDLVAAARAVLAAPPSVRRDPLYIQAKAVELMCLLMYRMGSGRTCSAPVPLSRQESRLHDARAFVLQHYAEDITLERISRAVGLNKMDLTSGFRRLFGMSVYDCLQKSRMERAYELLQDETNPIGQIAGAVGYRHACNFSTAFHAYFGCTPRNLRVGHP